MTIRLDGLIFLATFLLVTGSNAPSELCKPWERNEIFDPDIRSDESLWDPLNEILYPNGTYWSDHRDGNLTSHYGCPCMLDKPCIRKCCQMNEAMDFKTLHCISHEETWPWFQPNVSSDGDYNIRMENIGYFGVIIGKFCHGYILEPQRYPKEDEFFINFTDGTLSMPLKNKSGMGVDQYCLEYLPEIHTYLPYVCFEQLGIEKPPPDPCIKWRYILYPIGMSISVFFLLISLLVLLLLPDMRNLHGKCLMCHILSFLCAYIFLTVVQSIGHDLRVTACVTFGFINYFSLLCTFFWLNIMCVDIYVAFSSMKPMLGSAKQRELKKFIMYTSYAFGVPLIITAIAAFIELHPGIPSSILKPGFKNICWFRNPASRHAYFTIPVGVIVLSNVILFITTAFNIWKIEKETSMVHAENSRRHDSKEDKSRFNLYIRLSVVMGLSWIMEILSWIVGGSICYWMFTDLFNTLQGVFIFIIFICTDKVKQLIIKQYGERWPIIKKMSGSRRSEMPSASTSSSNLSSTVDNIRMKKKYPKTSSSSGKNL